MTVWLSDFIIDNTDEYILYFNAQYHFRLDDFVPLNYDNATVTLLQDTKITFLLK